MNAPRRMPDWSEWEGELAGGEFPLERRLGGTEKSAVFLTAVGSERATIKLVRADPARAAELVERWNRAALLVYPHLIRIVRAGTCVIADLPLAYLVMEYAEENLAAVLAERTLSAQETFEMVQPVADALAYLHGLGLVHGNLKPSNILAVNDTVKISCDAVSAGDPAEDVAALASAMVQALTQWTAAITPGSPDDSLVATLPPPFQEIARNCLCEDPRLRWSSARIATRLRSWQQPSTINPAPAAPVSKSVARKPKLGYYFAAFVLILLAAVIAGGLALRRTAAPAPSASMPQPVPRPVQPARDSAPTKQIPAKAAKLPLAHEPEPRRDMLAREGILLQILPDIPAKARSTVHGRATVVIRVAVDPSGNVTDAAVEGGGSPYFGKLALAAARHWQFVPVKSASLREWVLRFQITQTGTKVIAKERSAS